MSTKEQGLGVPVRTVALSVPSPQPSASGLSTTIAHSGHIAHFQSLHFITLWQPWASWIALGWKTVETRTHNKFGWLRGRRIGIHAGLKWDNAAVGIAQEFLSVEQMHITEELRAIRGAIVCTAKVRNYGKLTNGQHSRLAMIDCSRTVRHGLFLSDIVPLDPIVLAKGSQGVWRFDPVAQGCVSGCKGGEAGLRLADGTHETRGGVIAETPKTNPKPLDP